VTVDHLGHLDAAAVEDRRDDVGAVVVLLPYHAFRLDPLGQWITSGSQTPPW
jgi:hypothetical protein